MNEIFSSTEFKTMMLCDTRKLKKQNGETCASSELENGTSSNIRSCATSRQSDVSNERKLMRDSNKVQSPTSSDYSQFDVVEYDFDKGMTDLDRETIL